MLPSGIFVRIELDELISSLPGRLTASGPSRLTIAMEPEDSEPEEHPALELSKWSDEWCLIEITGPEELTELVVQSVVGPEPVREVLSCHFRSEAGEYGYAFFREGDLLETFESSGPSIETVNFTSELRRISLQSLLKASDFMLGSMSNFGIDSCSRPIGEVRKVRFHVKLPGKRTFWQTLLGAGSPK
jgi:hypothetical protein